jgi:hypothetical protein
MTYPDWTYEVAECLKRCAANITAKDAEIDRLRAALKGSLRQWKMYSEMAEGNLRFDLATEKSPEADMYRKAYALAHASEQQAI